MNADEKFGGFFQFPLCLLAYQAPFKEVLELCFCYGVCHFLDENNGKEWRKSTDREIVFAYARTVIGFTGGSCAAHLKYDKLANGFETHWKYGLDLKTCWVRLRTDIYFSARDGPLGERNFRVLAAIYSSIGNRPMGKLGWQGIHWRAAGWMSAPPPTGQSGDKERGPIYSRGQIERSAAYLIERGFVFAATYRRGERYWSHRRDYEGLWEEIAKRKLGRITKRRSVDDSLHSAEILAKLHPSARKPPPANTSR
jgi:hypothetical protein